MLSIEKQILFLLSRTESMDSQEILQIYEKQNYGAPYIRNSLAHLKKEGYAIVPSRSVYQITESGRAFVNSINRKPLHYGETWNGSWFVVTLEIPEKERKKRDQFRSEILQYGFGLLYNSVYISPWNNADDVMKSIEKLDLFNAVTIFQGSMLYKSITSEKAADVWKLDKIEKLYESKWSWFTTEFQPSMNHIMNSGKNPLDIFLLYLQLGEVISELYLIDPMLPDELLPSHWKPKSILKEMRNYLNILSCEIPDNSPYARFIK